MENREKRVCEASLKIALINKITFTAFQHVNKIISAETQCNRMGFTQLSQFKSQDIPLFRVQDMEDIVQKQKKKRIELCSFRGRDFQAREQ